SHGLSARPCRDGGKHRTARSPESGAQRVNPPPEDAEPVPESPASRRGPIPRRRGVAAPDIDWREERPSSLPGNRYLRLSRPGSRAFTQVSPEHYVAGEAVNTPTTPAGRFVVLAKRLLIGRPIPTAGAAEERLTKTKALAILASDALASVAYG